MTPHPDSLRLQNALERCRSRLIRFKGEFFRCALPRYANKDDIITGIGSKGVGGRWNPPGSFRTVYGSLEVETAVAEVLQHYRYFGLPLSQAMPRVIVALRAKLTRVLDLSDGAARLVMGVSRSRILEEPWRERQAMGEEALTQALGRLAYELDFQGLIVPSAASKIGSNLIVFPANLDPPGSFIGIVNRGELPRNT